MTGFAGSSGDASALLASLPAWAFAAMILVSRVGTACMLLPGIGEMELPMTVRAGFVMVFVALLLPVLGADMPQPPGDIPRLAAMLLAEIVTGLWLGWLARMILLALPMAGQIIATAVGLTNVLQPDAMLGAGASALSKLCGLAAPVLVMATGLYAWPLAAVVGSYRLVGPGLLLPAGDTSAAFVSALSDAFGLGLRLAAPFVMAAVLFHAALGLVGRLVPQLQTYFAAMPGQILGGLLLLGLLIRAMAASWLEASRAGLAALPGL